MSDQSTNRNPVDGTVSTADNPAVLGEAAASVAAELAHIRHELMTPLNQIIGYSEMLLEEAEDANQESMVADLHRVRNASNTLVNRINEYFGEPSNRYGGESASGLPHDVNHAVVRGYMPVGEPSDLLSGQSRLLVVDDLESNRDVLARRLRRQGHFVATSENGREALEMLHRSSYDLVLLDVLMPEMDGYTLLQLMKQDDHFRSIPVIMISALGELDSVVRCIEMGAEDYLPKPFNPILLRARVGASLEKKRFHDRELAYLREISAEREKADNLLFNVLPTAIAQRLKSDETLIADRFEEVSVLFADIEGFTNLASRIPPDELIGHLDAIFSAFDRIVDDHKVEKIKTIGDCYLVVGGLPLPNADHLEAVAKVGCAMCSAMEHIRLERGINVGLRIGIHVGTVVAGVIGKRRIAYDLWGDTVNIAHRMQAHGTAGRIHVSREVQQRLEDIFSFEERGEIEIKGKGRMQTAFLLPLATV